ncbi:hypothetical protein AAF712_005277 [Marasmius tenuissimus]|uniref:Uncharacterized protein n=1 Tax=Marasmius tenuissimus TaxID=585030 RepID=A0ABR3A0U1_9AGAR
MFVDDNNAAIIYNPPGEWTTEGCQGPYHTCHTAVYPGASLSFDFTGTFVEVFGAIKPGPGGPNTLKCLNSSLDGTPDTLSPIPIPGASTWVLYQPNGTLADKAHTLSLTLGRDGCSFTLYYILVQMSLGSATPTESTTDFSVTSSSSISTSGPSENSTSKVNVGGVVGGVIAALVVLAALVLFILHWRRRQRRTDARHSITPFHIAPSEKPSSPPPTTPTPITPPSATPALAAAQPPPLVTVTRAQPAPSEISPTSLPPPSFSLSSPTIEDEPPPPFVAGTYIRCRTTSKYVQTASSMESLPPTEFGYGGGLMLPTWRRNQDRHQPS